MRTRMQLLAMGLALTGMLLVAVPAVAGTAGTEPQQQGIYLLERFVEWVQSLWSEAVLPSADGTDAGASTGGSGTACVGVDKGVEIDPNG